MTKCYVEILFCVESLVFAKAAKSLKPGEESVLHNEARIEHDSFFEVKQFLQLYLSKHFFKQSRSLLSLKYYLKIIVVLRSPFFHS